VANEGVLLHDRRRFSPAKPKALNAEERLALAERNFTNWFDSASEFWRGCRYYMRLSITYQQRKQDRPGRNARWQASEVC